MANNCSYYLKAVAKDKNALGRLYKIMKYEDADYCLYRVREAHAIDAVECVDEDMCLNWLDADSCESVKVGDAIFEEDDFPGYFCLFLTGDVAWSAASWFDGEDKPDELADNGTAHLTSLNVIAKKLGIGVELWGHEEFNTLQQHFIMNAAGEMAVAETKDWNGYSEAEIEDMKLDFADLPEEVNEDGPLNDPDFDPDELGFGEHYCCFSSANKIYEAVPVCVNTADHGEDAKKDGVKLKYKITADRRSGKKCATIIGANVAKGDLVIPAVVEGCPVTSIRKEAFKGCSELESVTMPDGITHIGSDAFSGCSGLKSVMIPDSMTSIGNHAFLKCSGLTSVTIPDSVTSIEPSAFSGCSGLKSVTIPNSVTSIGNGVFYGCSVLTSVTMPDSLTEIGDGAFEGCSGLASVTIPDGVTCIGKNAFEGCSGLKDVASPQGVTSIGSNAFSDCSDLKSVTIPDSVTSIGAEAFYNCHVLESVAIPDSVTSIGDGAFDGCESLKSINVEVGNPHYKSVGDLLLTKDGATLVFVPKSLRSVIIPDGVTGIGDNAFKGCSGLTSVTIPDSVTEIGVGAFEGDSGLKDITIPQGVASIGNYAFEGCSGLESVTIGSGITKIGDMKYSFKDKKFLFQVKCNGIGLIVTNKPVKRLLNIVLKI